MTNHPHEQARVNSEGAFNRASDGPWTPAMDQALAERLMALAPARRRRRHRRPRRAAIEIDATVIGGAVLGAIIGAVVAAALVQAVLPDLADTWDDDDNPYSYGEVP